MQFSRNTCHFCVQEKVVLWMNFIAHMFFLFDQSGSICIMRTPNTFVFFGWGGSREEDRMCSPGWYGSNDKPLFPCLQKGTKSILMGMS